MTDPRSDAPPPTLGDLLLVLSRCISNARDEERETNVEVLEWLDSHLPEMLRAQQENEGLRMVVEGQADLIVCYMTGDMSRKAVAQTMMASGNALRRTAAAPSSVQGMIDERARLGQKLIESQAPLRAELREESRR